MISKKDSKPFLIKNPMGLLMESSKTITYSGWKMLYGLISDPSGSYVAQRYGIESRFDKVLVLNANEDSRSITKQTVFLLDDVNTSNYPKGNYKVSYIYPEYNREIVIGLEKIEGVDMPKIYFSDGEEIYSYQLNFDKDSLIGYVGKNVILPFGDEFKYWSTKPTSVNSETNTMHLLKVEEYGIDPNFKHYKKLTFTR